MRISMPTPFPDPPPGGWAEQAGRWALACALTMLFLALYLLCLSRQPLSTGWASISGVLVLGLGVGVALLVQGGRPANAWLLGIGAPAVLVGWVSNAKMGHAAEVGAAITMLTVFAAAMGLGTWAARGLRRPGEWLTVILCAAVGDAWLTVLDVARGVPDGHPLAWMCMKGLAGSADRMSPVFTDLFFLALYLEAGRRLKMRVALLVFGALTGYAGAEVISLTTRHAMPTLPLMGLGALAGAWSELHCQPREVLRGLVVAMVLSALLLSLVFVRRMLHPIPRRKPEVFMPRDLAHEGGGPRGSWGGRVLVRCVSGAERSGCNGFEWRCWVPVGLQELTCGASGSRANGRGDDRFRRGTGVVFPLFEGGKMVPADPVAHPNGCAAHLSTCHVRQTSDIDTPNAARSG